MSPNTAVLATDWGDTLVAVTVIAVVGALVLLVVWQVFALIKKGMERADPELNREARRSALDHDRGTR